MNWSKSFKQLVFVAMTVVGVSAPTMAETGIAGCNSNVASCGTVTTIGGDSGYTISLGGISFISKFIKVAVPTTKNFDFESITASITSFFRNTSSDIGMANNGHTVAWNDCGWTDNSWAKNWWTIPNWNEKTWPEKTGCSCTDYNPVPKSKCEPAINSGLLNYHFECLNDSVMLDASRRDSEKKYGWQYAKDSFNDGVDIRGVGIWHEFELQGMAFRELPTTDKTKAKVVVVISSTLPYHGAKVASAQGGVIGHGDLFLNFTGTNFDDASNAKSLYAVKFSDNNDSGVSQLGVYKKVAAKSVSVENRGFDTLASYISRVNSFNGTVGFGDLPANQTYYAQTSSKNVIAEGMKLGSIKLLSLNNLLDIGFDPTKFCFGNFCQSVIGFEFDRDLIVDDCGVFGGNGSSCTDCAGVACGTAKKDACGVCGGNGSSCLDCAGKPNGGTKIDACGVCGGNGSTCADCAGVPNGTATVDRCGVCISDKNADQKDKCLVCAEGDITNVLMELDGVSLMQRDTNVAAANLLARKGTSFGKDRAVRYAKNAKNTTQEFHVQNWTTGWSFPAKVKTCENSTQCVAVSQQPAIDSYRAVAQQQYDLGRKIIRKVRKISGSDRLGTRLLGRMDRHFKESESALVAVPTTNSVCK
jgi:hypothetical protein